VLDAVDFAIMYPYVAGCEHRRSRRSLEPVRNHAPTGRRPFFSPWACLDEGHRPLGSIHGAAEEGAIQGLAQFRSERNGCPVESQGRETDLPA